MERFQRLIELIKFHQESLLKNRDRKGQKGKSNQRGIGNSMSSFIIFLDHQPSAMIQFANIITRAFPLQLVSNWIIEKNRKRSGREPISDDKFPALTLFNPLPAFFSISGPFFLLQQFSLGMRKWIWMNVNFPRPFVCYFQIVFVSLFRRHNSFWMTSRPESHSVHRLGST